MTAPNIEETQIRETAYLLWLDEGQPQGRDQEHWLKAIDVLTSTPPKSKPARKKAVAKPRTAKTKATTTAGTGLKATTKATSSTKNPRSKKPPKSTTA